MTAAAPSTSQQVATGAAPYTEPATAGERVRLHITPFNPDLLRAYVPPALQSSATGISYHRVEMFPEKGFGYVELPAMEGRKLKRKLNGTTLKGSKVRIEEARPEKKRKPSPADAVVTNGAEDDEEEGKRRSSKRVKSRAAADGVLEGVELPEGRKVKRGWTEPAEHERKDRKKTKDKVSKDKENKKKSAKSQYSTEPELLFKTTLPPNKAPDIATGTKAGKSKDKGKKSKTSSSKDVVVHEFARTRKQVKFARGDDSVAVSENLPSEYIEGKGWVDEEGNIIEPERKRRLRDTGTTGAKTSQESDDPPIENADAEQVSTTTKPTRKSSRKPKQLAIPERKSSPAPSQSSSASKPTSPADPEDSADEARSDAKGRQPDTPPTATTPPPPQASSVHPLEALFKRPRPAGTPASIAIPPPIDTSFSFFGNNDDDDDGDADSAAPQAGKTLTNPPQTPFTRQDLRRRTVRSAAPTPDTAAIGKRFLFPWAKREEGDGEEDGDDDDDGGLEGLEEEPEGGEDGGAGEEKGDGEESEFAKWFWENRGDNNRAWKKRRREAMKAVRQRENRRLGNRLV